MTHGRQFDETAIHNILLVLVGTFLRLTFVFLSLTFEVALRFFGKSRAFGAWWVLFGLPFITAAISWIGLRQQWKVEDEARRKIVAMLATTGAVLLALAEIAYVQFVRDLSGQEGGGIWGWILLLSLLRNHWRTFHSQGTAMVFCTGAGHILVDSCFFHSARNVNLKFGEAPAGYVRAVRLLPSPTELLPGLTTGAAEVSRFSCMKFLGVPGVLDYAGPSRTRAIVPAHVAFRHNKSVGVRIASFRSSIPTPPIPLFTLRRAPRDAQRKTRGRVDR